MSIEKFLRTPHREKTYTTKKPVFYNDKDEPVHFKFKKLNAFDAEVIRENEARLADTQPLKISKGSTEEEMAAEVIMNTLQTQMNNRQFYAVAAAATIEPDLTDDKLKAHLGITGTSARGGDKLEVLMTLLDRHEMSDYSLEVNEKTPIPEEAKKELEEEAKN